MPNVIHVTVDNRLRVECDSHAVIKRLRERTSHLNPDYQKKRALGMWLGSTPTKINTWSNEGGFSLPRGATRVIREVAREFGLQVRWIDRRVSAPVEWEPFRAELRPYQEDGILACLKAEQGIVRAPTGCISGDAVIGINRAGKSFSITLAELVRKHRGDTSRGRAWDPCIPTTVRSRGVDGFVRLTRLVDAYESGQKQTYRVRTSDGHELRATADHRFLTEDGWLRLAEIEVGTPVWVEGACRCTALDEHRKLHAADAPSDVLYPTVLAEVIAIEEHAVEQTYDLSLEAPNNFLANGVVVHNSGKTLMALAALPRLGQRSLVIVRDRNLQQQWVERAQQFLGLKLKEIGIVGGGKRRVGERLTVALQQSLYSRTFPIAEFSKQFGAVIVDEVHDTAARTVGETVDMFPARVRLGFSADHTRRDRKEFLIEDLFGDVIFQVGKQELEVRGAVVPVIVRLVPTDFAADWYADAPSEERDFTRLISEMVSDEQRCMLVRRVIQELVQVNAVPALVFTHRREHAQRLAEVELPADGVPAGLLLGSQESSQQFEESKALLLSGVLKVAVGTFKAVGQGIDIPNVMAGVCATPIGANRQFFGQVRGRICRVVPGKRVGHLYYLWDRLVFPDAARNLLKWNDGLVEVYDRRKKGWVAFQK